MDHHESDLYVYVTSVKTKVIDEHFKTKAKHDTFVKTFRDNLTHRPMYDIAFAYDPWWLDKTKLNEPKHHPYDPETECILAPYIIFHMGTHREEIWQWFEDSFHICLAEDLMY